MKVVRAAEMREIDRRTIEELGIPSLVLMENAGVKTVLALEKLYDDFRGLPVVVVCGSGNNGGDGFVIARHLHNRGACVEVWLGGTRERLTPDAGINFAILDKMGIPLRILAPDELPAFARSLQQGRLVIDALLGTGLSGELSGEKRLWIEAINHSGTQVVAVDLPSGICADTGRILGVAIRAAATVTMGLPKAGLLLYPGAGYRGRLFVADIGFPREWLQADSLKVNLLEEENIRALLPQRKSDGHKGNFGRVLLIGGSRRYPGALVLAVLGCLQAGAGLVTAASTVSCLDLVTQRLPEAIRHELPADGEGRIQAAGLDALAAEWNDGETVLALGPGLDQDKELSAAARRLFAAVSRAVLDADGLTGLIGQGPVPGGENKLITPHPGEAARLLETTVRDVQADRIESARRLAGAYGVNVLLKGAGTVLAAPDGRVLLSRTGNTALAKGGTGDVLTGVAAAFIAQGLPALDAGALAAWVHGRAGEELSRDESEYSVRASQVAERIGGVLRTLHARPG